MSYKELCVIIIGGGPVGLTAAHALYHAGIDFILLEQRSTIYVDSGASLVLGPGSLRVMHQLGILNTLLSIGAELDERKSFLVNGDEFASNLFYYMRRNHGTGPVAFHRAELVQALHQSLPEKAKNRVLVNKKVAQILSCDEEVRVSCTDGSTYNGSILLGADGVHSVARRWMRNLALDSSSIQDWDAEEPFESTYRCLWCSFPRPTAAGSSFDTQHRDRSVMYITGRERGWMFLYEKLSHPTRKRVNYTEKDVAALVDRFADFAVTETLKVKDVFAERITSGMANLEEGIAKNWSWNRIVLAGDACHKFTPNSGLGFQNGIQDVVSLCNKLQEELSTNRSNDLTSQDFTRIFDAYKKERSLAVLRDANVSGKTTRLHAWAHTAFFTVARYIMPLRVANYIFFNWVISAQMRESSVLNYVAAEEPFKGLIHWRHGLSPDV